jgi:ribose transport system substrate-binding protein
MMDRMTAGLRKRLLVLFLLVLTGCRKAGTYAGHTPGHHLIGFSQMENNGPWRIAESASMASEFSHQPNYEVVVTDAQGQTAKQVSDVEDLVSRRCDAIFLAPRDFEGLAPALQAAREAHVPVFLVDRLAAGIPGTDYVTFLGSDFISQGRRAGEWLRNACNGHAGIVELCGSAGSSVASDRARGFRDAIAGAPAMKILASQDADFSRATGQKVMENIIQSQGQAITAVYAHNDEMALGAVQALKDAGRKPGHDVLIVSIDGERAALEAIVRGDTNLSVESNPRFGPLAFETVERYWKGEPIPPRIILEDKVYDAHNAAEFAAQAF